MLRKVAVLVCGLGCLGLGLVDFASAISSEQKNAIVDNCGTIKEDLKNLQHSDSRARVYLGRYYETILTKYITPLNVRLVENHLSNDKMIDNQNDYVKTRTNFTIDYIEYQKALEDLVAVDCRKEAERFYDKLVVVREKREIVAKDVKKMRTLITEQVGLVEGIRSKI